MACTEYEKLAAVAAVSGSYGVASAGTISHGGVSILEDVLGFLFKRCRWRLSKGIVVTIQEVTGIWVRKIGFGFVLGIVVIRNVIRGGLKVNCRETNARRLVT
jgi:hypothetical protein